MPPDTFISVTEETNRIVPLGRWILQEACHEAVGWPDDVRVAVNLSPVQFNSGNLVQMVADARACRLAVWTLR
jgi:EAL domain-containing protein (putative c-di-GMP-specific phosphodiesterase class I)